MTSRDASAPRWAGRRGPLGDDLKPTDFMVFQRGGQSRPLRAFEEQGRVLLLDLEYPALGDDADGLRAVLGAPEAQLDFPWNVLVLPLAD